MRDDNKSLKMEAGIISRFIKSIICQKLSIDSKAIDDKEPFFSLGITSLISMEIHSSLCEYFGNLTSTILFEYPNIQSLSKHLAKININDELAQKLYAELRGLDDINSKDEPITKKSNKIQYIENDIQKKIAIIGLSGRFPDADNVYKLYNNLLMKKDSITEIPKKRWSCGQFYSQSAYDELNIESKWGGFIDDLDRFDPYFFKISPNEAKLMDPQQKLFLECTWEAMEDSGYGKIDNRPTDNIGVYAGITWNEYSLLANEYGYLENKYKGPGSLYWGIPNRTSYFFNFTGPSISIDSACSSSLSALHLAFSALLNGDCEMAVVGGVNLNLHPAKYIYLSKSNFLSTDGKCRSFGAGGDGYVPGEGIGVVVLKPLWNAIQDKDRIHAVISGTSVNHGGKVTGYTVPNPIAHKDVIAKALKRAKLDVEKVSYVECHGTGTELGDPIEIAGLRMVFEHPESKRNYCGIGSIKSNIGHLEAAAGIAGLIKVVLSMKNNQIPATLYCEKQNEKIEFDNSPFYLIKENQRWKKDPKETVYAGVSSFGAGGSNAHCIVESFYDDITQKRPTSLNTQTAELVCLSAKDEDTLVAYANRLLEFLCDGNSVAELHNEYQLKNIAYTLFKRETFDNRLAIITKSKKDLCERLKGFTKNKIYSGTAYYIGHIEGHANGKWIELSAENYTFEKLENLSLAWVKGAFDHIDLKNADRQLVYLPPYPFSKEHSWLSSKPELYSPNQLPLSHINKQPFIDHNESTIDQGRYVKTFDKGAYVLKDHIVNGYHVLPGVCHLEMALAAGESYLNRKIHEIRDVWFTNMISLIDRDQTSVCIDVEAENRGYKYSIKDQSDKNNVYSSGYLITQSNPVNDSIDLNEIKKICGTYLSTEKIYNTFRNIRIIQKSSFRVIEEFAMDGKEACAKIVLPRDLKKQFKQYVLHPALLDGAVQTAMIHYVQLDQHKNLILPFSFKKIKILNNLTTKMYAYSFLHDLENKEFSIKLINDQGVVAVELDHFLLQRYEKKENNMGKMNFFVPKKKTIKVNLEIKESLPSLLLVTNNESFSKRMKQSAVANNITEIIFKIPGIGHNSHVYPKLSVIDEYGVLIDKVKDKILNSQSETRIVLLNDYNEDNGQESLTKDHIENFLESDLKFVFNLAKIAANTTQPVRFILMYRGDSGNENPLKTAMAALFRAVKYENKNLSFKLVFYDREIEQKKLIKIIQQEFRIDEAFQEVAYDKEDRKIIKYYDTAAYRSANNNKSISFNDGECYLISGGMGGIGKILVKYLIENHNADIILVGRSIYDNKFIADHFKLHQNDTRLTYCQADITDSDSLRKLKHLINRKTGRLDGIIHCAGLVEDNFLIKKEWQTFRDVIEPKLFGTLNLDKLADNYNLQFFIVFSSITSIFGNIAQCDYAYANGFVDQFVFHRNQLIREGKKKGKTIAINWPYWKNGGMQLKKNAAEFYERTFRTHPLTNEQGLFALKRAMQLSQEQLVVMNGKKAVLEQVLNLANNSQTFKNIEADSYSKQRIKTHAEEDNSKMIKAFVLSLFADVLNLDMDKIDIDVSFEEYGLDSIIMIDIIRMLEKTERFMNMPNTIFIENNTIEKVINYFNSYHNHADFSPINMN